MSVHWWLAWFRRMCPYFFFSKFIVLLLYFYTSQWSISVLIQQFLFQAPFLVFFCSVLEHRMENAASVV